MNFSSDTSAPAHPNVLAAIARVNSGMEPSYGADSVTARVRLLLKDVFETDDFDVWMTASGTARRARRAGILFGGRQAVAAAGEGGQD